MAYLADLERCWSTCIRFSYDLADHVVRYHLGNDSIAQTTLAFFGSGLVYGSVSRIGPTRSNPAFIWGADSSP